MSQYQGVSMQYDRAVRDAECPSIKVFLCRLVIPLSLAAKLFHECTKTSTSYNTQSNNKPELMLMTCETPAV